MARIPNRSIAKALLGGLLMAGLVLPGPAMAQRDPAYEAARKAGQVGEKMDGYLGIVGSQPASIQAMVSDLNIKRRANYAERGFGEGTVHDAAHLKISPGSLRCSAEHRLRGGKSLPG